VNQAESRRLIAVIFFIVMVAVLGLTDCGATIDHAAVSHGLATLFDSAKGFDITAAIKASVFSVVFVNVLLQQLGLPVPAVPTLLIAGSLASSPSQLAALVATAVLASLIADAVWYVAGRAFGYRVLAGLCKLSLNPGSCATTAETLFLRWGAWSLIGAKLVPGFSIVGPPIAGSLKLPLLSFFVASSIGAGLWAGVHIVLGWIWRDQVQQVIETVVRNGGAALIFVAIAVVVWLGWFIWRKRRFQRLAAIRHLTPAELMLAMASRAPTLLLDLRGPVQIAEFGSIDGAIPAQLADLHRAVSTWKPEDLIVTLCACPDDATAVRAAHMLRKMGFRAVHPLCGGYESWMRYLKNKPSADLSVAEAL
jgi:membrane protein DedA with SNARE-associated domain/rhodanese-related sulfurtransferase